MWVHEKLPVLLLRACYAALAVTGAPSGKFRCMTESALKKSPLHERHVALGAKFAEFGGWEMPLEYAGVVAEHTAVRTAVGVFDVSHLGKATVRGPGAAAYVNSCLTNDLARSGPVPDRVAIG